MKLSAHSSPTTLGPAIVLTVAGARSASPAEVLPLLEPVLVSLELGVILHGRFPRAVESAITFNLAALGIPWVAVQKKGLEAEVIGPQALAGKLVKYQGQAEEICPGCQSPDTKRHGTDSYNGKQRRRCNGCGRTWAAA